MPQPPRPPTIPRSRPPWTPRRRTVTTVDCRCRCRGRARRPPEGARRAERRRGADARRARRRLRRHRHEPALRDEGGLRRAARARPADETSVYGVLSLIVWALTIIVTRQVRRLHHARRQRRRGRHHGADRARPADAHGQPRRPSSPWSRWASSAPSLLYGDGMITPAISVLSAVEGLEVAAPSLDHYVVPITVVILTALFAIQRFGTGAVGRPLRADHGVWFAVLAVARPRPRSSQQPGDPAGPLADLRGRVLRRRRRAPRSSRSAPSCSRSPAARRSTPTWATSAARRSAGPGSCSCSRRCSSTTSGRARWCSTTRAALDNPFYELVPRLGPVPDDRPRDAGDGHRLAGPHLRRVLGHPPGGAARVPAAPRIRHTSEREIGQIYVPFVNWALLVGVLALVVGFRSSTNLASAYGIAVTGTLAIDTLLVLRRRPAAVAETAVDGARRRGAAS